MPPRVANTSASARKRGGDIGRNPPRCATNAVSRTAVSRTAVSSEDIACMASYSTATTPSTPAAPAASASMAPLIRHSPRIEEIRRRGALSGGGQRVGGQRPPLPPFRSTVLPPPPPPPYYVDNNDDSQLDESQPLLSPEAPVDVVVNTGRRNVQSQLTAATGLGDDFISSEEEDVESVARAITESVARASAGGGGVDDEEDINFDDEEDINFDDSVRNDDDDSAHDGMNAFSSGAEFTLNERCSYYLDRVPITLINRHAVKVVFMVEAETLCRSENTMKLPEFQLKLFNRYKALISAIPASRFGDLSLKGLMAKGIKNSKGKDGAGSPSSHHTRTKEAKSKVQAIMRQIPTIAKLPSGRDIIDVRNAFILKEYKAEKGEVCRLNLFLYVYTNYFSPLSLFATGILQPVHVRPRYRTRHANDVVAREQRERSFPKLQLSPRCIGSPKQS